MGIGWAIFLGGLGWAAGGPIGALLGACLGYSIGGSSKTQEIPPSTSHRGPYRNTGSRDDLQASLLVLIAAMMKANGTGAVRNIELDVVKRYLVNTYGAENAQLLLRRLRDVVKIDIPVQDVCWQIKQNTDYTTRYHLLDFLFDIAMADNVMTAEEEALLTNICINLGILMSDYNAIDARHRATHGRSGGSRGGQRGGSAQSASNGYTLAESYKILGVASTATDDEVKKAYRRLAMKYHPDKVEALGEEMKKNAEAQFRKINEAYEMVKAARGIK